jgi:hypothetical protein
MWLTFKWGNLGLTPSVPGQRWQCTTLGRCLCIQLWCWGGGLATPSSGISENKWSSLVTMCLKRWSCTSSTGMYLRWIAPSAGTTHDNATTHQTNKRGWVWVMTRPVKWDCPRCRCTTKGGEWDAGGEMLEHHFWANRDPGRGCELLL